MKTILSLLTLLLISRAVLCFTNIDFLNTTLSASEGLEVLGGDPTSWLGYDVYRAGDVNKDGVEDFIIGAPYSIANSKGQAGAVFVIYGNMNGPAQIDLNNDPLDLTVGFKISGAVANGLLGSASAAGDFNNDGVDDVVVGAYFAKYTNRTTAGSVYVVYGVQGGLTAHVDLSTLTISQGVQIGGPVGGAKIGFNVRPGGDMNGDGIADIVFTAPYATFSNRNNVGATYVIYGKQGGYTANIDLNALTFNVGYKIVGAAAGDMFGYNLGPGRDLNGDSINDVIAGTYIGGTNYAVVIWGSFTKTADIDLYALTVSQGIKMTLSVSLGRTSLDAIDFDGDGFKDLIIGSSSSGSMYIVYGVSGGLDFTTGNSVNKIITTDTSLGFSLSCADINGDGFGDIITDSPPYGGVIFGPGGNNTDQYSNLSKEGQVLKFSPSDAGNNFGYSAATADINGDGLPDIIYGSDFQELNGQGNAGSVVVIYSSKNYPFLSEFICFRVHTSKL